MLHLIHGGPDISTCFFFKIYLFFILFSSFCFIYSFISMAGSACPGGGAGAACGAGDGTVVPAAAAAAVAFLSRRFRPLSHPASPLCFIFFILSIIKVMV